MGIALANGSALAAEATREEKPAVGMVTAEGLCVAVKPTKEAFTANEPLTFDVVFTNVSGKAFRLFDATYWIYEVNSGGTWACVLRDTATGMEFRPTVTVCPELHRIAAPITLEPGNPHNVKMDLTSVLSYTPVGQKPGFQTTPIGPRWRLGGSLLPPATYKLVLTLNFVKQDGLTPAETEGTTPFWLGTVTVETVPFKVANAATEAPAGWKKLFADEDWYRGQKAPERLFTGVLNATKQNPNLVTTLQRTSLYSLDRRTIYTGGSRVDVLDKLVGKVVTIRGKAVEMELEGRVLLEIWPAAVKEAREPLHPIEIHEIKAMPEPITPPSAPDPQPIRLEQN